MLLHSAIGAMRNHIYPVNGCQATAIFILAGFLLGPGTSLARGADQPVFSTPMQPWRL